MKKYSFVVILFLLIGIVGISYAQVANNPEPILDLIAIPGNGSVHLVWSMPDDNGNPILSYKVVLWETGSSTFTTYPNLSTNTEVTITGLKNDVSYSFRVYAVNSGGTSSDSNIATVIPSQGSKNIDVPDPIDDLEAIRGNGKVTLKWSKPFDNNSPITSYVVT